MFKILYLPTGEYAKYHKTKPLNFDQRVEAQYYLDYKLHILHVDTIPSSLVYLQNKLYLFEIVEVDNV